ncbi:MAG: hypothetical protein C0597_14150 [Marinilabiliales bacterium]|nr:MAG: hypothetical protein C0597_14150 [Marinilabiliales bacterium]
MGYFYSHIHNIFSLVYVFINISDWIVNIVIMNIQEIIVGLIVIASVLYAVYNIAKLFTQKQNNSCGCSSCDFKTKIKDIKSLSSN